MKILVIPFLLITLTVFSQNAKQGIITVKQKPVKKADTLFSSDMVIDDFGMTANFDTLQPEFVGGETAMKRFINSNLIYPVNSRYKGLHGCSIVHFRVAEDGSISNVHVFYPMHECSECDQEAMRVVKLMPKWKPGAYEPTGRNVASTGAVSIRFTFLK